MMYVVNKVDEHVEHGLPAYSTSRTGSTVPVDVRRSRIGECFMTISHDGHKVVNTDKRPSGNNVVPTATLK